MMPVIFVGHGTPMNAIENNKFTEGWAKIAKSIERPKAIVSISAHWFTKNTRINTLENPKKINDFYGFPKELYEVNYNAKGSSELAEKARNLLGDFVIEDNSWGIDHGTWSVLCKMYPDADIPVCQLSVDGTLEPNKFYEIGEKLKTLRNEGVLILASGSIVHNLREIDFDADDGYDWAQEFDDKIKEAIENRDYESVINYEKFGKAAKYSVPTPDHLYPLIYILGASNKDDKLEIYNNSCTSKSLSMTCYVFSQK